MPVGLVIIKWDDRAGIEVLTKHPHEVTLTEQALMQIYSTHEYSGESGVVSLMFGSLNIVSYYTGEETGFYILLLLSLDEDPDIYEGGLVDSARIIMQNLDDDAYKSMVPSLFQRISVYPTLNNEQLVAIAYNDEIKRMIINRLRNEGVISKSELAIWLKDKYKGKAIDFEGALIDLIKREIIKETSVKGMPSELIFLTKDVVALRTPPLIIFKDPADRGLPPNLVEEYQVTVKKYFRTHHHDESDILKVLEIFINPQVYETLRLLRTAVVTKNGLEKLRKKGVEDIDEVLKMLWDNQMIQTFQDERNNEYYALQTDFKVDLVFPKYLINTIKKVYEQKSKPDQVLVEYLNVLENQYSDIKTAAKAKSKE